MRLDVVLHIVREATNRPDVVWCSADMLNMKDDGIDGVRVTFADVPLYVSGEKVGQKNYRKRTGEATRIVTQEQYDRWVAAWEAEGNCENCNNTGEVFVRWDHIEGTTMRPCGKCDRVAPTPEPIGGLFA